MFEKNIDDGAANTKKQLELRRDLSYPTAYSVPSLQGSSAKIPRETERRDPSIGFVLPPRLWVADYQRCPQDQSSSRYEAFTLRAFLQPSQINVSGSSRAESVPLGRHLAEPGLPHKLLIAEQLQDLGDIPNTALTAPALFGGQLLVKIPREKLPVHANSAL